MISTDTGLQQIGGERAMRRPVVFITADMSDLEEEPTYRLRANYAASIVEAGGLALSLPYEAEQLSDALELADGVLITGSDPGVAVVSARIDFERALIGKAIAADIPLMGICHGMQLMGEHLGGSVARDRPDLLADISDHIPWPCPNHLAHGIELEADSLLYAWHGLPLADVNSLHRHALVGEGQYRVAAMSTDGIIEAIEGVTDHFCLGVQWHPEYRLTALDRRIFREFVARCRAFCSNRGVRFRDSTAPMANRGQA